MAALLAKVVNQRRWEDDSHSPSQSVARVLYYRVTREGHKHLEREMSEWQETAAVMARFLSLGKGHA